MTMYRQDKSFRIQRVVPVLQIVIVQQQIPSPGETGRQEIVSHECKRFQF